MSMAVNNEDQSYSHVGQFAQGLKPMVIGTKLDLWVPLWDGSLCYHRLMVQMHITFEHNDRSGIKQNLSEWRARHLTELQDTLQLGHPKAAVLAVWMNSLNTPYFFWRPGMRFESRQSLSKDQLEGWLRGGELF